MHIEILAVCQEVEFGSNDKRVGAAWVQLGHSQVSLGRLVKVGSLNSKPNKLNEAKQMLEEYTRIQAKEIDCLQKGAGKKAKAQIY